MNQISLPQNNLQKVYLYYGLLMGLVICEVINMCHSTYLPNSVHSSGMLLLCSFSIHIFSHPLILREKYIRWFLLIISLASAILVLRIILKWNFRFIPVIHHIGFQKNDIGMFRAWFKAYGWVINEWSALLITLLPIVSLTQVYFREWRLHLTIVSGILIAGILLSGSRGAFLATAAFYAIFIGLNLILLPDRKKFSIQALKYGLASLIVVVILVLPGRAVLHRYNPVSTSVSLKRSDQGRINALIEAKHMIRKVPYLGVGSGTYALAANISETNGGNSFRARVNNTFLEVLIERGLLGFIYFGIVLLMLLWYLIQKFRVARSSHDILYYSCLFAGVLAIILREVTFSSVFHNPFILCLFVLILHLCLRDIFRIRSVNRNNSKKLYLGSIAIAGVIGLCWALLWWNNKDLNRTIWALNANNKVLAKQHFDQISNFSKNNINYPLARFKLGTRKDFLSHLDAVATFTSKEWINSVGDPALFYNAGYLQGRQGRYEIAPNYFTKAARFRFTGIYDAALSDFYFHNNNPKEAEITLIRGILKQPDLLLSPYLDSIQIHRPESYEIISRKLRDSVYSTSHENMIELARLAAFQIYLDSNFREALPILEDVSNTLPNLSRVWYNLARCYRENKDHDSAIQAAKKAAFLSSTDYLPILLLAELTSGNRELARKYYERGMDLYFNQPTVRSILADVIYKSSPNLRYESVNPSMLMDYRPAINLPRITAALSRSYLLQGNHLNPALVDSMLSSPAELYSRFDPDRLQVTSKNPVAVGSSMEEAMDYYMAQYPEYINTSPDLSQSLFKTRSRDSFELYIRGVQGDTFTKIDASAWTQLSLTWHPDNRHIYFQEYDPGISRYRLYSLNVLTGRRTLLDGPTSSSAIPPLRFTPSGNYMAYLSTEAEHQLWLYDCNKGKIIQEIATCKDPYVDFTWDGDTALYFTRDTGEAMISKFNIQTSKTDSILLPLTAEIKKCVKKNDTIFCLLRESESQYFQLYTYTLSNQRLDQVTNSSSNVEDVRLLQDGTVIYSQNENGVPRVYSLNNNLQEILRKHVYMNIEGNANKFFLNMENFTGPRSVKYYDSNQHLDRTPVHYYSTTSTEALQYPKINRLENPVYHHEFEFYTWNPDTVSVSQEKKAILYIHGGPHIQEDISWDPMADYLTGKGYYFVKVNYSGSTGYTKDFERIEDLHRQSMDLLTVIQYLKTNHEIALEEIYLMSSSYGNIPAFDALRSLQGRIGGLICASGITPENLPNWPHSLSKEHFLAYYGNQDRIAGSAYDFLLEYGLDPERSMTIFRGEGHFFHKTSSWARICRDIIHLMEEKDHHF